MSAQSEYQEEQRRKWHVGREIPLALLFGILIQTGGIVWWAASQSAEIRADREKVVAYQAAQAVIDRKQDEDSLRSESRISGQIDKLVAKIDKVIENQGSRR